MIDLRATFSKHRVAWRDTGPNTSRGNVNIGCPFCKNDPSFHLAVSEDGRGYYCWRNSRHSGGSLFYLFTLLRIPTTGLPKSTGEDTPSREQKTDFALWDKFDAATGSQDALDYLEYRKFTRPAKTCEQFGLRFSDTRKWGRRILVPLTQGWTGRAIYSDMDPRYLSETNESGFFAHGRTSSVLLVEGPLDAMRLASVTKEFTCIATTGKRLSPALIYHLRALGAQSIYLIPDADVPPHEYLYFLRYLSSFLPYSEVRKTPLPKGFKDCCEMEEDAVYAFLRSL